MMRSDMDRDLVRFARSGDKPGWLERVDRKEEALLRAFLDALSSPLPIEEVEAIEHVAKRLWQPVLTGEVASEEERSAFTRFFHAIGFLFKYKPYGTKIATPFGFSIFDLNDGEGFSFQIHTEPKLEAFHVLEVKPRAFVYLSSLDEWDEDGTRAAKRWTTGLDGRFESSYAVAPNPGDVFVIQTTEVVHAVTGCVLEEYATCSVDAVTRLLDQNAGREAKFPARHPNVARILGSAYSGEPVRKMRRVGEGWSGEPIGEWIIDVPNAIHGRRALIQPFESFPIESPEGYITVAVGLSGSATLAMGGDGQVFSLDPGCLVPILPGADARVFGEAGGGMIALHSLTVDLLLRDWTS